MYSVWESSKKDDSNIVIFYLKLKWILSNKGNTFFERIIKSDS